VPVQFDAGPDVLTVDGIAVSLRLARSWMHESRKPLWIIRRRVVMPKGLILAIRLNEQNREIIDYFVMPTQEIKKGKIHFVAGSSRLEPYRRDDLASAAQGILEHAARRTRAVSGASKRTQA
jgi:hypothetical protein